MNKLLAFSSFIVALMVMVFTFPEGPLAVLLTSFCAFVVILILRRVDYENEFLVNIFVMALIARIIFGTIVHVFELRMFMGGDSVAYDFLGNRLMEYWRGEIPYNDPVTLWAMRTDGAGWGMNYVTGSIYYLFGRNIFAAQSFCAVFGAATAPMVYFCANKIFQNKRVAKTSAILIAFYPSFIIWSGQLLKDGLIIFLLVLAFTMVLKLQEKFKYPAVIVLVLSMFGIMALRFYIFYMVAIAVLGSFVIGTSDSVKSVVRGFIIIAVLGLALTYLGILRSATSEFEVYGDLERLQLSRTESSSAGSGFGQDIDVSTTEGAILAIPIGFIYLMFAPFPWQVESFKQISTLPDVFIWWASIPFLLSGLWFTMKHRFRNSISILIFTVMLTFAYSIFQGNVGTAYRQRTQIQVFLFIFVAVGITLWFERRENLNSRKELMIRRSEQINEDNFKKVKER